MATSIETTNPSPTTQPKSSKKLALGRFKGDQKGLTFERLFTTPGQDPYDQVEWELRDASITNERGEAVFEQKNVEIPVAWSQMSTNVVVSKYFRGKLGTPGRETSVRQLIGRVVDTIADWGRKDGVFATESDAQAFRDELTYLILHQKMAFNSPVWFNVGVEERPQASACFINSISDTMGGIMDLAKTECMLFKWGSGAGSNLSPIRSSHEYLSGGGTASGPVSFMRGYDAFAGVIKSGGKTRRAAKMVVLNDSHPDVMDFVWCKAREEKKAWALIEQGYDGGFNVPGGAYDSVFFQNANHSVRVSDAFMKAAKQGDTWQTRAVVDGRVIETLHAKEMLDDIAEAAWICGDPGMQYDTTINDWHTCANTDRINASNPCVTGDTLVATAWGLRRIDTMLDAPQQVKGLDGQIYPIKPAFVTGQKPVYLLTTRAGYQLKATGDHKVFTVNRGDVPLCELTKDDRVKLQGSPFGEATLEQGMAEFVGLMLGDGCLTSEGYCIVSMGAGERTLALELSRILNAFKAGASDDGRTLRETLPYEVNTGIQVRCGAQCVMELAERYAVLDTRSKGKLLKDEAFALNQDALAALLRGLFTADGTVANYGQKSQYVSLDMSAIALLRQVQLLLLNFGIKSKLYTDRRALDAKTAMLPDGKGGTKEYPVEQMHSLRISRASRVAFEQHIGFMPQSSKAQRLRDLNEQIGTYADHFHDPVESITPLGIETVYDLTEPETSHFVGNGIAVHNCSEYLFLDDTACNLASLNLMTYRREDGEFDVETFRHAVRLTLTAQEILVPNASYPTPAIEKNSHAFRPLGLGFANLGALLMVRGLPYDSVIGRAYTGAITALMCGEAYLQSAKLAKALGAFTGYAVNEEPMTRVIGKHRQALDHVGKADRTIEKSDIFLAAKDAWAKAQVLGKEVGFRNSQVTVLAPTGTISFLMDCDTTGIEPDIALVKYKKLVGGGYFKIVNHSVPEALQVLGYGEEERREIIDFLMEYGTIEGAPGLKPEHLPVFDCAFQAANGTRTIEPMGHVRMMAAAQPFLSGAISKTVNMPHTATAQEIAQVYLDAWKLGLKAIAIYRDGCKRTQPLSTSLDSGNQKQDESQTLLPEVTLPPMQRRRRLPDERPSITHKFSIAGHEGYINVGMYQDGKPGELFIVMSKEGSVVSGLMDSFATSISLCLQYGVPIEVLVDKFSFTRFEPSGFTNNPRIRMAHSITDYIFRWMADKFLDPTSKSRYFSNVEQPDEGVNAKEVVASSPAGRDDVASAFESAPAGSVVYQAKKGDTMAMQADAPPCHVCGSITVRAGACYSCPNCGATTGCG